MSINRVNITGNLTRDPELRATAGGTQVLSFGVAVNDRRRNAQTGEWEDYPNFVDCTMFGTRAEAVSRFLAKGNKVAIEGKLRYSSWERDGQRRSKLKVFAAEQLDEGVRDGLCSAGVLNAHCEDRAEHDRDTHTAECAAEAAGDRRQNIRKSEALRFEASQNKTHEQRREEQRKGRMQFDFHDQYHQYRDGNDQQNQKSSCRHFFTPFLFVWNHTFQCVSYKNGRAGPRHSPLFGKPFKDQSF